MGQGRWREKTKERRLCKKKRTELSFKVVVVFLNWLWK